MKNELRPCFRPAPEREDSMWSVTPASLLTGFAPLLVSCQKEALNFFFSFQLLPLGLTTENKSGRFLWQMFSCWMPFLTQTSAQEHEEETCLCLAEVALLAWLISNSGSPTLTLTKHSCNAKTEAVDTQSLAVVLYSLTVPCRLFFKILNINVLQSNYIVITT